MRSLPTSSRVDKPLIPQLRLKNNVADSGRSGNGARTRVACRVSGVKRGGNGESPDGSPGSTRDRILPASADYYESLCDGGKKGDKKHRRRTALPSIIDDPACIYGAEHVWKPVLDRFHEPHAPSDPGTHTTASPPSSSSSASSRGLPPPPKPAPKAPKAPSCRNSSRRLPRAADVGRMGLARTHDTF
ncbi:hypothetical protein KM043_005045 [Ampulex compressa]|nr:hypothetical protein KM043_005045 [Ampulex compressa]